MTTRAGGQSFKRITDLIGNEKECLCRPDLVYLKLLVWAQIPPLSRRQGPQQDPPNAYAFQSNHFEPHKITHPANLPFPALAQYKPELLRVLPFNRCRLQHLPIQGQPMPQLAEL
eukprot:1161860-Pelagomonas_calceolata.AAC.2